ncbi:FecR family protein [Croceibacterium aestuarii]|uniref:FecR family protein n=1 Tax=Croceibacterium aestuarii TaxID=3064139 RepID=UPI00272EC84B|nr:FecR domain-containing protein [Croceibacterium sp. D39]
MQRDERIRDEAAAWAVRAGDPGFADWDAFEHWLGRSPEHAAAYDRVAAAAAEAAEELRAARPASANDDDVPQPARVSRRWFDGALAAALVAVLAFAVWPGGSTYYEETAPGEIRMIALGGGDRIDLAGGTRIELDRDDPRFVRLESGRALFTIRHDEAHPFRVVAGDDALLDVGTVFDVALDEANVRVAVAEGAVVFNPARQAVHLAPGEVLRSARGSDAYRTSTIAPAQVGEWREGRLSFDNASLAEAASDLARATGVAFRAAPGSTVRISGSIVIAQVREDPRAAGALLGVPVRREGDDWVLGAN